MFIVFTKPNQFVESYDKACQIADDWFKQTNEIVAVELSQHHPQSTDKVTTTEYHDDINYGNRFADDYYFMDNDYDDNV